tara:strand:- start:50 stop:379 length:330 start_codon:yes stop_codon:yes gene_type:complete
MKKKITECVTYLHSLLSNTRDCNIKSKEGKVYGYTFRNLKWNKLNTSKVKAILESTSWDYTFKEGADIDPRTKHTDKAGNVLESTFIYIGKDFREEKSLEDLTDVDIDV